MNVRSTVAITLGKICASLLRTLGKSASTWPGEVALRIDPTILKTLTPPEISVILVLGTNGKTTTTKLLETILTHAGSSVVTNHSGANLDNGLISILLQYASLTGKPKHAYALFEVDEMTLARVLPYLKPKGIVLLNLFRDQLDRYGEVDTVARSWKKALTDVGAQTAIVANGDDPLITDVALASGGQKYFFGLDNPKYYLTQVQHAVDSIFCPRCGERLHFAGFFFSHLGKWDCPMCRLVQPKLSLSGKLVKSPLEGVYNIYNVCAATLVAQKLGILQKDIDSAVASFVPAFGRLEDMVYKGRNIRILLSKNPTGFNESLRTVLESKEHGPIVLALNDNIPDGRDVSWIWDTDFEVIADKHEMKMQGERKISATGLRAYDMAVRLKYAEVTNVLVYEDIEKAIQNALENCDTGERISILATYSAMLEVRRILIGRSIN